MNLFSFQLNNSLLKFFTITANISQHQIPSLNIQLLQNPDKGIVPHPKNSHKDQKIGSNEWSVKRKKKNLFFSALIATLPVYWKRNNNKNRIKRKELTINPLREQSPMWFHNSRLGGKKNWVCRVRRRKKYYFLWLSESPSVYFEGIEEERKTFPWVVVRVCVTCWNLCFFYV